MKAAARMYDSKQWSSSANAASNAASNAARQCCKAMLQGNAARQCCKAATFRSRLSKIPRTDNWLESWHKIVVHSCIWWLMTAGYSASGLHVVRARVTFLLASEQFAKRRLMTWTRRLNVPILMLSGYGTVLSHSRGHRILRMTYQCHAHKSHLWINRSSRPL